MWVNKELFATCSSGLCNRLFVLAGSMRIARRTGRRLALYWPVNPDLGCAFDQLFINPVPMVAAAEMAMMLDTTLTVKVYNAWRTPGPTYKTIKPDGDPDADIVIIKGWSYPMFEGESFSAELDREIREHLLSLTLVPEIQSAVDAFAMPAQTIGVHVRRGDHLEDFGPSKNEHFIAIMRGIQHRRPGARFFLATDVAEIERLFRSEFGDALMTIPKTWAGRHEVRGGREALMDLRLLARTAAILGNIHSSFSQAAGYLRGVPMVVADETSAGARLEQSCDLLAGRLGTG